MQPLAPGSRRHSQNPRESSAGNGLTAPHPYSAAQPTASGYRGAPPGAYGRNSPMTNGAQHASSQEFMYGGGAQTPKNDSSNRGINGNGAPREMQAGGARGIAVYDREQQMEHDEEGHGRKGGFWSVLCCRA